MTPEDIIIRPVLTEKGYDGIQAPDPSEVGKSDKRGCGKRYTFEVLKSANKTQIKIAVEQKFNVQVESVHTVTQHGKLKRQGRSQGYTPAWKKAIVSLKRDSKPIEYFESLS